MRIMPGGALEQDQEFTGPSSVFVGRKLDEHRGAFLLEYPMDKGHVIDGGWDSMERIWEVGIEVFLSCRLSLTAISVLTHLFFFYFVTARLFQA